MIDLDKEVSHVSVTDSFDDEIVVFHSKVDQVVGIRFVNGESEEGINMVFATPKDTLGFLGALLHALESVWGVPSCTARTRQ